MPTEGLTAVDFEFDISFLVVNVVGSSIVPIDSGPALSLNSLLVRLSLTFAILPGNQYFGFVLCPSMSTMTVVNSNNCSANASKVSMKAKQVNSELIRSY